MPAEQSKMQPSTALPNLHEEADRLLLRRYPEG